jgi:hypothetical protein
MADIADAALDAQFPPRPRTLTGKTPQARCHRNGSPGSGGWDSIPRTDFEQGASMARGNQMLNGGQIIVD